MPVLDTSRPFRTALLYAMGEVGHYESHRCPFVNLELCRVKSWYLVAPTPCISRETVTVNSGISDQP
jgi:hypothetical protein